jgi:YjbE family integral membrane protein
LVRFIRWHSLLCAIGQDLRHALAVQRAKATLSAAFAMDWPVLIEPTHKGIAMELFSAAWWSSLMAIILIDLVLAGDNAIVIALAARSLPPQLQKKAILWGTVGAIGVRAIMTVGVVWLLQVPGLMLLGGLGLVWIAYKLLADQGDNEHATPVASTFWGAMKTIVVADALMGVDNVLGVAGAAHGAFDLVIIGLLISVPIVVFGSSVVLKLVERFPAIIQIGAAVLALTAAQMIVNEPWLDPLFDAPGLPGTVARWATYSVAVLGVLLAGRWTTRRSRTRG